jgi:hypothetical protein
MNDETPSRAKLLDNSPTSLTTDNIPVRTDIFIHDLEPLTLEALHQALAQGLRVSGLDFGGDDDSTVVLRFTRMPPGSESLK